MRYVGAFFVAVAFLFSSIGSYGQQSPSSSAQGPIESKPTAITVRDCHSFLAAAQQARRAVEYDRSNPPAPPTIDTPPEADATIPRDIQGDLRILEQTETQLNQCILAAHETSAVQNTPGNCSSEQLLSFQMSHRGDQEREIPIWHLTGDMAFFFEAGMTIDADGAPNAYHPDNTGLDDLANAGEPGIWEGLAKDSNGEPMIQGPDDPYPGYYISATALADRSKAANDPSRYVDASKIPYIVLPGFFARQIGARPGDFSIVVNKRNGKFSYAIFGDVGPSDRIGEGSVALAENLGIRSDARNGGARGNIFYLVFPGSGNGQPRTIEEINAESEQLLQTWGGAPQLTACADQEPARLSEGIVNTN